MSKVLIVVGSRREGNSLKLAQKIKKELKKERIISNIIIPGNQKIYVCTGCMDCDINGVCDFFDDMISNIEKVNNSDALIFITPTRWNLLSGDIKIFMDRLNPLYVPKKLKNKKAIVIAIGGNSSSDFSTNGAVSSIDSFCESSKMKLVLKCQINNCLEADDIENKEEEVNKIINDIKNKLKTYNWFTQILKNAIIKLLNIIYIIDIKV